MWGFLVDIANKVGTLYTRLSAARALLLDNLDAAISSRADAATAVSSAVLTPTRIGYLDTLAGGIATTMINRIQTGYLDMNFSGWSTGGGGVGTEDAKYQDVTITAVNTAKSIVLWQPVTDFGDTSGVIGSTARLTSTTNLRVGKSDVTTNGVRGRWTVLEFK